MLLAYIVGAMAATSSAGDMQTDLPTVEGGSPQKRRAADQPTSNLSLDAIREAIRGEVQTAIGGVRDDQIVLGKSVRIPGSVTSDEELSSHSLAEGQDLEAEEHRQRLELRCQARKAFFEADNSQTIRRAMLRRSNPVRGPYLAGSWVLYWTKKSSPNRLAAGRWHGPAKVICQEGQSVVWVAHGSTILRCAPENLRPASLREWQSLTPAELQESPSRVGGASSFVDLTVPSTDIPVTRSLPSGVSNLESTEVVVPGSTSGPPAALESDEVGQPEQELTPQVSIQEPDTSSPRAPEVERDIAAPSVSGPMADSAQGSPSVDASTIPVPESEDGLYEEPILLTSHVDHVENQVTQKMQQTINLLEDMTGKYTAHGEILKQLQEANREFQLRLGTLEKNGGGAGSTTAGSTVGQPSDGGRQPALVTGGWNPDQDARETRQAAEDILRSVEAPIDLEGMFVPGIRRGYAILPINELPGESTEARRARVQDVISRVRAANVQHSVCREAPDIPSERLKGVLKVFPPWGGAVKLFSHARLFSVDLRFERGPFLGYCVLSAAERLCNRPQIDPSRSSLFPSWGPACGS